MIRCLPSGNRLYGAESIKNLSVHIPQNRGIKHQCLFSKLAARMGVYNHGVFIFMGC